MFIAHRAGAFLIAGFLLSGCAFAQTAVLNGIVRDSSGAVIAGAQVSITNLDTGLVKRSTTSSSGAYNFNLLPVGRYRADATMAGFGSESETGIKLDVDQVVRLDITLKPGAVTESVEVSATAPLLDSETSTVGPVSYTHLTLPTNREV